MTCLLVGNGDWTLLHMLHAQASNLQHRHADRPEGSPPPEIYRVNDRLVFSIDIEELSDKGWRPFKYAHPSSLLCLLYLYFTIVISSMMSLKMSLEFQVIIISSRVLSSI